MIEEAKQKRTDAQAQPKLPLIRLRVTYQNEDHAFNEIRFGQQYNGMVYKHFILHFYHKFTNDYCVQVANPSDIVKMQRNIKRVKSEKKSIDNEAMNNAFERVCKSFNFENGNLINISMVREYLQFLRKTLSSILG